MLSFKLSLFFGHLLLLLSSVSAQQFAGTSILNSLPSVPTSEVAFFAIKDANNKSATLINYISQTPAFKRLDPSAVQRVVIIVHGLQRDPWVYMGQSMNALQSLAQSETSGGPVNMSTVQLVAPYFPDGLDKNYAYPWNASGTSESKRSYSNALVWSGSQWISGANNQYPTHQQSISSYAVLDQMVAYYANKTLYPNLKHIVLGGHSAGAQFTQRYAAVGNALSISVPVTYWVANPDSYLWFSDERPLDTSYCPSYDDWRSGLANYTNTYGEALVDSGRSAVYANYNSHRIAYARGTLDDGDASSTCAEFTQGNNREERFYNFIEAFPPTCKSFATCDTVDYVVAGHDAGVMMSSTAGIQRLFLDNWSGNNSMAYDFGCPRLQIGDNPYPGTCNTTTTPTDAGTFGNFTYMGCYTDQAFYDAMPYEAISGSPNLTISTCTTACAAKGYSLAGLENAEYCFCGNSLYYGTYLAPDSSCSISCAGNSSQICGGYQRMSVLSVHGVTPVINPTPVAPATVGSFAFEGCYSEVSSSTRALTGASLTSTTMTLEVCVAYCRTKGYVIAGVEYASQCFCGNTINALSNVTYTPECDFPCAGNSSEFCGASGLISLYANATLWGTNYTVAAAVTTTAAAAASATSSAALVTATSALSCPSSDGLAYVTGGDVFVIECYGDRAGNDLTFVYTATLELCLAACASTSGCLDVSWVPGTGATSPCYMKSAIGVESTVASVWGARFYGKAPASNTTMTTSASSNSSTGTLKSGSTSASTSGATSTTKLGNSTIVTSSTTKAPTSSAALSKATSSGNSTSKAISSTSKKITTSLGLSNSTTTAKTTAKAAAKTTAKASAKTTTKVLTSSTSKDNTTTIISSSTKLATTTAHANSTMTTTKKTTTTSTSNSISTTSKSPTSIVVAAASLSSGQVSSTSSSKPSTSSFSSSSSTSTPAMSSSSSSSLFKSSSSSAPSSSSTSSSSSSAVSSTSTSTKPASSTSSSSSSSTSTRTSTSSTSTRTSTSSSKSSSSSSSKSSSSSSSRSSSSSSSSSLSSSSSSKAAAPTS